jgi:hypothetical protein
MIIYDSTVKVEKINLRPDQVIIQFLVLDHFVSWSLHQMTAGPGNTKGGSITVPLTSCLTGLELAV